MKNIIKTIAIITIFTIFTRLSGFIFRIWLSREIGAEALGIYQIGFSVFAVLVTLCCSGIPLTVSRYGAKYKALNDDKSKFEVTSSALIISGISAIFLCIVILASKAILCEIFTEPNCFLILVTLLPAVIFSAIHGTLRGYLWGENDYLSVCIIELIEQYIRIIACVIALAFAYTTLQNALSASWSLTIAIFCSCLCIIYVYKKKGGKILPPKHHFKEVLNASAPITALRFISSLIMPLISILVPLGLVNAGYTNSQALELLGIAMGMAYPLLFLPTTFVDSVSLALIPTLSTSLAKNQLNEIRSQVEQSFLFASYISCMCIPLFSALGKPICLLLFENSLAGNFLSKASILIIPICISNLSTSILNSLGYEKSTFKNFIYSSIPLVALIFITPRFMGIDSIVLSVLVQSLINCILNVRLIMRLGFLEKSKIKTLALLMCISFGLSLITHNIYSILNQSLLFINLLICSCLCACSYVFICNYLKLYDIKSLVSKFVKRKNQMYK